MLTPPESVSSAGVKVTVVLLPGSRKSCAAVLWITPPTLSVASSALMV